MKVSRRQLILMPAVLGTGIIADSFLNDKPMIRPPKREGYLLTDLHAHLPLNPLEDVLDVLSQQATCLAAKNKRKTTLRYEQLINHPCVTEITKGKLAKVTRNENTGYIIQGQEVICNHHILSIGAGYMQDYSDPRNAILQNRLNGGLSVLCHWNIVRDPYPRTITPFEAWYQPELARLVDEVEVYSAVAINSIPFINFADYSQANNLALYALNEAKTKSNGAIKAKGIAVSDAHTRLEQVGLAGIYLPTEAFKSFDALKHHIQNGLFERCDGNPGYVPKDRSGTVSRLSFLKSIINR